MNLETLFLIVGFAAVYFFIEKWGDVLNLKEKLAMVHQQKALAKKYRKGWHRLDFVEKVVVFLFLLFLIFGFSFWVLLTLPLIGSIGWIVGDLSHNLFSKQRWNYVGDESDIDSTTKNVWLMVFIKLFFLGVSIGLIVWNWGLFPIGDFG